MSGDRLQKGTYLKCDMHVHSSSCYSRKYDKKSFFEKLTSSDLDVVAVTDHNIIDLQLLNDLQSEMKAAGKTLLGGVELNVKLNEDTIHHHNLTLAKGAKGKYFHAVVWFDFEQANNMAEIIKKLFIEAIVASDKDLTRAELSAMDCKHFSEATEGIAIEFETFRTEASLIPYLFIPHENKGSRNLSDYLPNKHNDQPLTNNLQYKNKLFYYSDGLAIEGGQKSRKYITKGLAEDINTTVAALYFSDAKKLNEIGSKYTWIDFDRNLDSLMLAISDPESRIRTSDEDPDNPQKNTDSFLESIEFDFKPSINGSAARPQRISFSPGYNGIVGSRGSGKSLLACILAKNGIDNYSKYVNTDSIKFKLHDDNLTANRPDCLYLGQGELEDIYTNGNYEEIPFLKRKLEPIKKDAQNKSATALEKLKDTLDREKETILAFNSKYENGPIKFDYLNHGRPSGIAIEAPEHQNNDFVQIENARTLTKQIVGDLEKASKHATKAKFHSSFPENEDVIIALEKEARELECDIAEATEHAKRFSALLEECNKAWFNKRTIILEQFNNVLAECNRKEDSAGLDNYIKSEKRCQEYCADLLELRMTIEYLDDKAEKYFKEMTKPVEPIPYHHDADEIIVSLTYSEDLSYADIVDGLLKTGTTPGKTQAVIASCLAQPNKLEVHNFYNGTKFRSVNNQNASKHVEKYFELLTDSVSTASNFKTEISINKKALKDMSPGTKAQSLLKLFLNDEICSGKWKYIVLDQPEDNLDVATIKAFLIDRLKKLKTNVQFFVVSHSAPTIINGDARTIIVCNNKDEEITYGFGGMNEASIKQSIADVLDGGERYLKMRLNKYNFSLSDGENDD